MKILVIYLLLLILVNNIFGKSYDVCSTKVCLLDSLRLFEYATDDEFIEPCENFTEYSLEKFLKISSVLDPYDKFSFNSLSYHQKRQRKILRDNIIKDELKVHKIAKNFFQKCIDTNYIRSQGKQEVVEFLRDKSFPVIDGADWNPNNVNLSAILQSTFIKMDFFITHKITRCADPRDPESTIFCWRYNKGYPILYKSFLIQSNKTRSDLLNKLKEIDFVIRVDKKLVNASITHFLSFLEEKLALEYTGRQQTPIVLRIKDISRVLTPHSKINFDWLAIINQGFLEHSQAVSSDEEILIDDWTIFAKSLELIENTFTRNMIDVFFIVFLLRYEHTFIPYPLNRLNSYDKKEIQRFEQCLNLLEANFAPTMLSLLSNNYQFSNNYVEEFVHEGVLDVLRDLEETKNIEVVVKDDIRRKFKKIKIILGVHEEIREIYKMKELHQELDLSGNEGILETSMKLIAYNEKLNNEPRNSWYFIVNQLSHLSNLRYFPEIDVLFVPIEYLLYPFFDSERPRFFNTASLFTEVVFSMQEGLKKYLLSEFKLKHTFNNDSTQLSYYNYKNWLKNNTEKILPGFSPLQPAQMYWMAFANTYFMRYINAVTLHQKEHVKFQLSNFHVWLKSRKEFRAAFNCSDLSFEEEETLKIKKTNFNLIFRN